MRRFVVVVLLGLWLSGPPTESLRPDTPATAAVGQSAVDLAYAIFSANPATRRAALGALERRGKADVAPALILALRMSDLDSAPIVATLRALTGADPGGSWHEWMLWQQAHPEIVPFDGFGALKADAMALFDDEFRRFLRPGVSHEIRLEEIVWGGVVKDGIPALNYPVHVGAAEADYLADDDLVFGVAINGEARAYPLRILDWHEMANDWVGGMHVTLAYCTLCGSGILYQTQLPPRREPFVFGSSGFLYRSNNLMYDQQTHSLWNQFTGRPGVGPLVGSGIRLEVLPLVIERWRDWRARHPETKVLSIRTGYSRDYTPCESYGDYFASDQFLFPALVADRRLRPKDYVFALRIGPDEKAWPLTAFTGGRVISDRIGGLDVVLIGNAAGRTVRAYRADGRVFVADPASPDRLKYGDEVWRIEEAALVGPQGERLARLPGHIAYGFAFAGFAAGAPVLAD